MRIPTRLAALVVLVGTSGVAHAATCPPDFDLGSATGTDLNAFLGLGAPTTTCGAINDFGSNLGDTVTCANGQNSEDITFRWVAPGTGGYVITTDGSSFDTALQVRTYVAGSDCGMTQLACDDDGGTGVQSLLTFQATAGQAYLIVVDGYSGGNCGDWVLSIACGDSDGDGVCDAVDLCDGDDAFGDTDGDGTCNDIDPCPTIVGLDLDNDGVCDGVDLCFGDNSYGDADGDGTCEDLDMCFGDDSTGDSDGDGTCDNLDSVCNNFVADLGSVIGASVLTGNTVGGGDTIYAYCAAGGRSTAEDLQYLWTAPAAGDYTFDLVGSSYDTVLYLGEVATCGQTAIACNDDSVGLLSSLTQTLSAGQQLVISIDGYAAGAGAFVLNITSNICVDDDGDGICNQNDRCFGDDASGDADNDALCNDLDVVLDVGPVARSRQPIDFVVNHAAWSGRVYIAATIDGTGAGPCLPLVGICTDLLNPVLVGGAPADPFGVTVLTRTVPYVPAGRRITYQAAVVDFGSQSGQTSNVVSRTVQ